MISALPEDQRWPRRRWVLMIFALLALQLALIFWLSGSKSALPARVAYGPKIYLPADSPAEWPAVSDPALFALANRHGFSGSAWMKVPPLAYDLPKWKDEQVRPLQLATSQLGAEVGEFLRTNLATAFELPPKPEPDFDVLPPPSNLGDPHSVLTIEGELANRPLLSNFKLASWPAAEILTNSTVAVTVNADGNVFSAVLLAPGCGSKEADANALQLAASARFQPLPPTGPVHPNPPPGRLQWGTMVFHWHTIPTNAPVLP